MAVSGKLRDLVRDATLGMADVEVCERTGINYATWRRMLAGHVPSDAQLLKFAIGLQLDAEPFLRAAAEVRPRATTVDLLRYVLEASDLTSTGRMQIMQLFRELQAGQAHNSSAA